MSKKMIGGSMHQEHEEGEAWLVSYADMMTLLFGLFVILYSMSKVDESKFSEFRKEISDTFGGKFVETFGSDVGQLSAERQLRAFQMMVSMMNLGNDLPDAVRRIEAASAAGKVDDAALKSAAEKLVKQENMLGPGVGGDERVLDIALAGDYLFQSGSAELKPEARAKLKEVADELNRMQGFIGLEVVGHSDGVVSRRRNANQPDNWALSAMRAASVARSLIAYGVDKRAVTVSGKGDLQPLFPERRENGQVIPENMARNRRVHIIVTRTAPDAGQ